MQEPHLPPCRSDPDSLAHAYDSFLSYILSLSPPLSLSLSLSCKSMAALKRADGYTTRTLSMPPIKSSSSVGSNTLSLVMGNTYSVRWRNKDRAM